MSRDEKRRANSRMAPRDTRLLSEMLNNLANEELKDSNKSRMNTANDLADVNLTRYNTVTTNMFNNKMQTKLKAKEEM